MKDSRSIDCVVCGSCVIEVLVHPFTLDEKIEGGRLYEVGPLQLETGGMVCRSVATLARLGQKPEVFSFVGNDEFGAIIQ